MVVIRSVSSADAAQIEAVMRDSWQAAYDGIIAPAILDRATAPDGGARIRQSFRTRPWQRMIAAVHDGIVGYAAYGPERDVLDMPWPYPLTPAGSEHEVAELYALYVHPAWWSTGTGRALMDRVLAKVRAAGYTTITLWVLEANARARRFYARAGFVPDGARHLLDDLGGVTEVRYRRALARPGWQARDMAHDDSAAAAAATYFDAWRARDFARLRTVLADDVTFTGPMGQAKGPDECLRGLRGLAQIMTGIEVREVFAAGSDDVLTWYDMLTSVADPVPVANWMHVENGKITRIRAAFDPRGIAR